MATFTHGKSTKLYVNGFDLSSYFNKADLAKSVDTAETSAFNSTSKSYIPGLADATLSADGMLDITAGGSGTVVWDALGVDSSEVSYLPTGDTIGEYGYGMSCEETDAQITSPVDGVNAISLKAQSSSGAERIVSHRALASAAAPGTAVAGTATVVDNTAATTVGGVGYLHVTGTPSGTVTVTVQDSANNVAYTDLFAFAAVTGGTSQRVTVAGTVRRYTRAVWAGGAAGGGTATFFCGVGRTPYL